MVDAHPIERSHGHQVSLTTVAPALFVLLWSTGFISARYGLPYAEPFTFLFIRMTLACFLLVVVSVAIHATFPRTAVEIGHVAVSGLLLHAGYLGGVFYAIDRGLPAGVAALIVGLQPVLTAVVAQRLLHERVTPRQWLGLTFGFIGVGLVVEEKIAASVSAPIQPSAFLAIGVALLATTAGALYQKRFVRTVELAPGAAIQYLASGVALGVLAFSFESMQIDWTGQFLGALAWAVVVLSLGAILLLLHLIREHSISRISSLMYLVPPVTALQAYVLFDERLGVVALFGMGIVVLGVALVVSNRGPRTRRGGLA